MRTFCLVLLMSLLVFPIMGSAQQPAAQVLSLGSNQVSIANYNDAAHSPTFPGVADTMKRFAMVVTNSTNLPVVAINVVWKWTGADGKPGLLTQTAHNLIAHPGFTIVNPRSTAMILPDGTPPAQPGVVREAGGSFRVPLQLMNAPAVSMTIDALVLADGQVIGPDQYHLVADLQGKAEAVAKMRDILTVAKAQGRDPKADIDNVLADTSLAPATRRHMTDLAHSHIGNEVNMPDQILLPKFYRK